MAWILAQPLFVPYSSMEAIASMSSAHRYTKAPIFLESSNFLGSLPPFPLPATSRLAHSLRRGDDRASAGPNWLRGAKRHHDVSAPCRAGAKLVCLFLFFFRWSPFAALSPRRLSARTCFFALVFIIAMPFCCAYQCNSRSEKGFSLFNIPWGKRDVQRKKQWLHNIGRKDFAPTRRTSLCEVNYNFWYFPAATRSS